MENQAYVFVSNKDNNSYVLLQELQKIDNWKNLFSIVSVHAQKNLVKRFNIQKVPSILWNEHLFVGQDALSFIKENINEQKSEQKNNNKILYDYDVEEFSSLSQINQQIPSFTKIEESGTLNDNDLDINSRMQQYNSQRKAIDSLIENKKSC